MILICDSIMGTGKTSASITYMNEHSDEKYIYITPYLKEAERIRKGCKNLKFIEPSNKLSEYKFRKIEHTAALIKRGANITTTHQAFKFYTPEMLKDIKENGYNLIIDENVDVIEKCDTCKADMEMLEAAGFIKDDGVSYQVTEKPYKGKALEQIYNLLKVRSLNKVCSRDDKREYTFFWVFPPEFILSFNNVIVMTYLFEAQSLHHFLKIHNINYKYIGVRKSNNIYRFCEYPGDTPEYVSNIKNMIHILEDDKMNNVGIDEYSLSMNWFLSHTEEVGILKRNLTNYLRNRADDNKSKILWGTYKDQLPNLKGKGYTRAFLPFNEIATNEYKDRNHLAYAVNVFMNVGEVILYDGFGIAIDQEMYALSIMVQWIWRSAIREGHDINLYLPSRRMRRILKKWMLWISENGNRVEEAELGMK